MERPEGAQSSVLLAVSDVTTRPSDMAYQLLYGLLVSSAAIIWQELQLPVV